MIRLALLLSPVDPDRSCKEVGVNLSMRLLAHGPLRRPGRRPQRLQANPLARFFLDRQAIRMAAFRGQITEEEVRALEAYIGWLRGRAPVPGSGKSLRHRAAEGKLR